MNREIRVVFHEIADQPGSLRFVEVEDSDGNSISAGEWRKGAVDGEQVLVVRVPDEPEIVGMVRAAAFAAEYRRLHPLVGPGHAAVAALQVADDAGDAWAYALHPGKEG